MRRPHTNLLGEVFVVIPVGLGVLALESAWDRLWLERLKASSKQPLSRITGGKGDNRSTTGSK